jgi:type IV pilus assembly protein PilC
MIAARRSHLAIFSRQFAAMLASGLHLVAVLENLAAETPHRRLRGALRDVAQRVTSGSDLADALERHPGIFDGVFIGLVRSGVEAGRLCEALSQVMHYIERGQQMNRKVIAATAYPAFVIVSFFAASATMVFFVLPQFASMFRNANRPLPGPTLFLLDAGNMVRDNAAFGGVLLAALAAIPALRWASPQLQERIDYFKMQLPVLGPIWRLAALGRFARTLAVQVSNQVSVIRALQLAAAAAGNRHVELQVLAIAADIETGASITHAFRERPLFSGIVLQMIASGEESGRLDELLISAANYFESLLMQRIDTVTTQINPLLTAFIGLAVAGMMIAAYLPVFDMAEVVQ